MDRSDGESDARLVARWRRGDGAAAAALVERYADAAGAVAFAILGDFTLAEDVVQDTFARASDRLKTLRDGERVGPWLTAIARNLAKDEIRKRNRETPLGDFDLPCKSDPRRETSLNELNHHIRDAVAALPESMREVFLMKYMTGMRYNEIAEVLGLTKETVAQRIHRARQKLQRDLEAHRP
jgi:RNA polymerase sigma-70 factor, ECF subfamily